MPNDHMLNLVSLAGEPVDAYALYSFVGREAFSEPFDYVLQIYTDERPQLKDWIGKLAEFTLAPGSGVPRSFSGRIYAAHAQRHDGRLLIEVRVGPALLAVAYESMIHIFQDRTSLDIFGISTKDIPGLITTISTEGTPPVRGYVGRFSENGLDFLTRVLAQDGLFFYFVYDRDGGGAFRHRMVISNKTGDYIDLATSPVPYAPHSQLRSITALEHHYNAAQRKYAVGSFNPNNLDDIFAKKHESGTTWGAVMPFRSHEAGFETVTAAGVDPPTTTISDHSDQQADLVMGTSGEHALCVAGRFEISDCPELTSGKIVLTSVNHNAVDPWMLGSDQAARYSNSFTAIDATQTYRPAINQARRVAPGPQVAKVTNGDQAKAGAIVIDKQWRIPVELLANATYGTANAPDVIWLPVMQQWANATHGAQFFPRIGARVVVDFLYGNPDLPFVSGSVYTPNNPFPFDPTKTPTQSGWRSITEENGAIKQELHFDDKKGAEEIYLYTGRNYRRQIDADELSTIGHDQTEEVKNDQTLTVKHDQKITVENDQTEAVKGKVTVDVTKTQTVTVTETATFESKKEIVIKVGGSSITLSPSSIDIKSAQINIKADATVNVQAGASMSIDGGGQLNEKAAMVNIKADGPMVIGGAIVKIN